MNFFIKRESCPICDSDDHQTIFHSPMDQGEIYTFINQFHEGRIPFEVLQSAPYQLLLCKCGFVWQKYVLNDDYMKKFYTEWIPSNISLAKRTEADLSFFENLAKNLAFLKKQITSEGIPTCLDYGMGWGNWAITAMSFGFESFGYEISEERKIYASKHGVTIIEDLETCEKKFDLINAEQVLEHIQNPKQTLSLLASKLNKDGILQIAVPDSTIEIQQIKKQRWVPRKGAIQPLDHINSFTPSTLVYMLKKNGFQLIKKMKLFNPINGHISDFSLDFFPEKAFNQFNICDKFCFKKQ